MKLLEHSTAGWFVMFSHLPRPFHSVPPVGAGRDRRRSGGGSSSRWECRRPRSAHWSMPTANVAAANTASARYTGVPLPSFEKVPNVIRSSRPWNEPAALENVTILPGWACEIGAAGSIVGQGDIVVQRRKREKSTRRSIEIQLIPLHYANTAAGAGPTSPPRHFGGRPFSRRGSVGVILPEPPCIDPDALACYRDRRADLNSSR